MRVFLVECRGPRSATLSSLHPLPALRLPLTLQIPAPRSSLVPLRLHFPSLVDSYTTGSQFHHTKWWPAAWGSRVTQLPVCVYSLHRPNPVSTALHQDDLGKPRHRRLEGISGLCLQKPLLLTQHRPAARFQAPSRSLSSQDSNHSPHHSHEDTKQPCHGRP